MWRYGSFCFYLFSGSGSGRFPEQSLLIGRIP